MESIEKKSFDDKSVASEVNSTEDDIKIASQVISIYSSSEIECSNNK